MLGKLTAFKSRNELADAVPSLVVWEKHLEEALTGNLLRSLLVEVSSLTDNVVLQEAHSHVEDGTL